MRQIILRAIVCRDEKIDLIIGLPSILHYNLLPLLTTHININKCCKICTNNTNVDSIVSVAHILHKTGRNMLNSEADKTVAPEYDNIDTMTATMQHLQMSELLHHDENAIDPNDPNDIDVSRMITGG